MWLNDDDCRSEIKNFHFSSHIRNEFFCVPFTRASLRFAVDVAGDNENTGARKNFFAHLESSPVSAICFRHANFFLPFDDESKTSPLKRRRPMIANRVSRASFCCRRVENYRRHSRRLSWWLRASAFCNNSWGFYEWNSKVASTNAKVKHPPL